MIVVPKKRALVLKLQDPGRVVNVVPTAKVVRVNGQQVVAVPHKLDEVKVLRNLGLRAPSPIKFYHPWPARWPAFEAQRETAEFLTLCRNAFILNELGCVDADTEYLSPTGWVKISQYSDGEVAQYIPETGAIEFVEPAKYVRLPCSDMLRIKTKYGVDQLLSPEHRVLLRAYANPDRREVVSAAELYARQETWRAGVRTRKRKGAIGWSQAAIPVTFSAPPNIGLPLNEFELRVQVAVVADAHFPNGTSRCAVRLKKQRKKDRLRKLLAAAAIEWQERECGGQVKGFTVFSFVAPLRVKVFGAQFWRASPEQLRIITDEVMHWDGSISASKPTQRFSTLSRESADFVQYAFAANGRVARIREYLRRGKTEYEVLVRNNGRPLLLRGISKGGGRLEAITPAQSPDGFKYCFEVPSSFLLFRRHGCIFASGNTGKTLSALWAYDYLRSIGELHRALVVAPLSTLERVWGDEIFLNFPHLTMHVVHGTRDRRMKLLAEPGDVYIINHDGVKTAGLVDALAKRPDIDLVIVDEVAQVARNAGTDRWKALNKICNKQSPRRVWGLTGTPTPNSPTDAWAQCRLISPSSVPPYFNRFRDLVMRQVGPFSWVPRDNAVSIVHEAMQPSVRFTRDECQDLPPVIYQTRSVELTPEQKKAYKDMMNNLRAEVDAGEILAVNEAVKMSKLLQIVCGIAYGPQGQEVTVPNQPRMDVVLEILEQAGSKVIIFVPFVAAAEQVHAYLQSNGRKAALIHGGVGKSARDEIFRLFQNTEEITDLVAQPAAMSHGLTLTAASTVVWYSAITSNETYEQANGRITRPGQKFTQFIINIEGSAIERKLYDRLRKKQAMQGALLELVKGRP